MTLSGSDMSSSLFLPVSFTLKRCISKNPVLMSSTWIAAPLNSVIFSKLNFDTNQIRHVSLREHWRMKIKQSLKLWWEIYKLWNDVEFFINVKFIRDKAHILQGSWAGPTEGNLKGSTKRILSGEVPSRTSVKSTPSMQPQVLGFSSGFRTISGRQTHL